MGISFDPIGRFSFIFMNKKNKPIRVNVCWECGDQRQCKTMQKEDAYRTRRWVEANDGFIFWFQALDE